MLGTTRHAQTARSPYAPAEAESALPPRGSTRHRSVILRGFGRSFTCAALTLASLACSEPPLSTTAPPDDSTSGGSVDGADASATVYWNGVARNMVISQRSSAAFAIRAYAIVSLAQYNAAVAAEKEKVGRVHPSIRAAIGSASVTNLAYLYPTRAPALDSLLAAFLAASPTAGEKHGDLLAGVEIGRRVGNQVVARAQNDRFFAPGTLTPPVGPGYWSSSTPPAGSLFGRARTFLLQAGDQFRPPPPPAFESPEYLAALAEVRRISDARTPEQAASAKFWDAPAGTHTPAGHWNEWAAKLAVKYQLNDRKAARLFALMNMVAFDAIVASHEAKYFYWLLRPTMADPAITVPIVLPNFPSYPSNHAAISGGMARILAHHFPSEKARLEASAEEAALSRVLGGIHYRFDGEAGLVLGRRIAAWALANDVHGHEPYDPR